MALEWFPSAWSSVPSSDSSCDVLLSLHAGAGRLRRIASASCSPPTPRSPVSLPASLRSEPSPSQQRARTHTLGPALPARVAPAASRPRPRACLAAPAPRPRASAPAPPPRAPACPRPSRHTLPEERHAAE
eukprot:2097759-Rhodomonas_salina.1